MSDSKLINRRYRVIDQIGEGGMGTVFKAYDRLTHQTVALKQVIVTADPHANDESMGDESRQLFAREFAIMASLRHPHIVSVLDYGFDEQRQPYITMELLDDPLTVVEAGEDREEEIQVDLISQMLQALSYLHRRNIIHRDLKPDNALVSDNNLKVLDFGLAILKKDIDTDDQEGDIAGTLAYLAPENLQGHPPAPASDLYATGIMAYEIFAGEFPYNRSDINMLIADIFSTTPDATQLPASDGMQVIVQRLLEKDPADRYQHARDVLAAISDVTGNATARESAEIRESFLQSAQFTGRDAEFSQLVDAFQSTQDGHGTIWLVGGESGVGKSRLLQEFRVQALVQGAYVLTGREVSEGGRLYQSWVEVLRRLLIILEPDDTTASVLKPVVPDIEQLLERPIANAPELDPQATKDRFFSTIEDLFQQITTPTVIVLEDLHWANESIDVIKRLSAIIADMPVILIGTYRSDERPSLPESIPSVHTLELEKLSPDAIAELTDAMIGEAGQNPDVVQLLQEHTGGNVLFIIEAIRTLAEQAGSIDEIGTVTLSDSIFAQGIGSVIGHRLEQITGEDRDLLQVAAITGRELDTQLLAQIAPDKDIDRWLYTLADALIIEVVEEKWLFTHDKIRENLLDSLDATTRADSHQQVAQAIEAVYPDTPGRYADLLYHWSQTKNTAKEFEYAYLSGHYTLDSGAHDAAIQQLLRARQLATSLGIGEYKQGRIQLLLGEAYYSLGQGDVAKAHLERAMEHFGSPVPSSPPSMIFGTLGQVFSQVLHRQMSKRYYNTAGDDREKLLSIAFAAERLSLIAFINQDAVMSIYASLVALNSAEIAGPSRELSRDYVALSVLTGTVLQQAKMSDAYFERALSVANEIESLPEQATVWFSRNFYLAGRAKWDESKAAGIKALDLYQQIGDERWFAQSGTSMAYTYMHTGELDKAEPILQQVLDESTARGDVQMEAWSSTAMLNLELWRGHFREQSRVESDAPRFIEAIKAFDKPTVIVISAMQTLYYLFQEMHAEAGDQATQTLAYIEDSSPPSTFYLFEAYATTAHVFLQLWQNSGDDRHKANAARGIKALKSYAQFFPIGRSRLKSMQAWQIALEGNTSKAQQTWQEALDTATEQKMPFEQAFIEYLMVTHLPENDPQREKYLNQSRQKFEAMGATYFVDRVATAQT